MPTVNEQSVGENVPPVNEQSVGELVVVPNQVSAVVLTNVAEQVAGTQQRITPNIKWVADFHCLDNNLWVLLFTDARTHKVLSRVAFYGGPSSYKTPTKTNNTVKDPRRDQRDNNKIMDAFKNLIQNHGSPDILMTDNGHVFRFDNI